MENNNDRETEADSVRMALTTLGSKVAAVLDARKPSICRAPPCEDKRRPSCYRSNNGDRSAEHTEKQIDAHTHTRQMRRTACFV